MYKNNIKGIEAINNLMCTVKRYDIINYLINKNKFSNYLEIGVYQGDNIRKIQAINKDGVDPGVEGYLTSEVNYPVTSDEFFKIIKDSKIKYDVIFIDGLHHADQVNKDIENSLKHLLPGGYIVVHDCIPINYEAQKVPRETLLWNGDVWRSIVKLRLSRSDLQIRVVDTDFGIGIINFGYMNNYRLKNTIDWEYFNQNKKTILNIISVEEFEDIY
ncbi:class I SAM-dependent methyltransferase [Flavobacterium sp. CHNK8]|uniref:class I SAM-dependent methyltransferase n=1 Tax=Flavobacterium sp. CHNK8 TaxID=2871165 RepID=UPI001C8D4B03|nr:class I SAM-dependent methyltransferase [Flavobacterium sp. CHNK8]QZK91025.1 class I SAM-dependent methyltransferase [Flavobacterium sp. CHNK8]